MSSDKRFWMVWNPGNRAPTVKHPTLEKAKAEAQRLARTNPGQEFIVLQSLGAFKTVDVEWKGHADDYVISLTNTGNYYTIR